MDKLEMTPEQQLAFDGFIVFIFVRWKVSIRQTARAAHRYDDNISVFYPVWRFQTFLPQ